MAWAEAYLRTQWHLDPCSGLATIWAKLRVLCLRLFGGGAGSPSNTMSPGPRPTSVPSGILIIQPFGHNRHGPKIGGCALFGRGAGSPSNTVKPGPIEAYLHAKFHLDPSNCLAIIHQHNRQTGQNGPIGWANRFANGRPPKNEFKTKFSNEF